MSDQAAAPTSAPQSTETRTPEDIASGVQSTQRGAGPSSAPGGAETLGDIAKEAARKLRYKTDDGRDEEVDEAEVLKIYKTRKQHQAAASRELNEGKSLRAQAEKLVEMLKDEGSLKDVLRKLGHDPRKLSEKILSEHLEDELMDPRDRELRDTKARLRQIEEMEARQREAIQARRAEEMKSRFMAEYEADFVKALDASGLPPTKPMVAEMAKYISRSAKIGFKMSASEAAQLVREDIQLAHKRLIGDADGDSLIKLLGEDVANKVRKYDTSKLKNPTSNLKVPNEQATEHRDRKDRQPVKRLSRHEWRLHKMGLK